MYLATNQTSVLPSTPQWPSGLSPKVSLLKFCIYFSKYPEESNRYREQDYGLDDPEFESRHRKEIFLFLTRYRPVPVHTASCWIGTGFFPGVVPPGREVDPLISQTNPTRCTILFNIFIYFSSLHLLGTYVPIIRRKLLCLSDNDICHSVSVVYGQLVGFQSNQQNRRHPYRVTNTCVA